MTATKTYRIASIPVDGVGIEVVTAGRRVLDRVADLSNGAFDFNWTEFDWGSDYYARNGRMMPEDGLETLAPFDAIYFGAVGWENVPDHVSLWGLRLNITQNFDQWANIRPVRFLLSTPQNAIVYGSGCVPITKMVRSGISFDILGGLLIVLLLPLVAGLVGIGG